MLFRSIAALLVIYVLLGVLYESYIHPITILAGLPSAAVGALLTLKLFGLDLTLIATIGILLLIGIVKKNAIMMIDFALEAERTQGLAPRAAIHQACLLRFRPILMTTMAALLGALPLALRTGDGAARSCRRSSRGPQKRTTQVLMVRRTARSASGERRAGGVPRLRSLGDVACRSPAGARPRASCGAPA